MRALGMIETMGLIPSIEALDAMLKAANVETLEKTNVRGGIVTVVVEGDVAAVKAAVDAGAAAAQRISQGSLLSQHVIPRPDSQIDVLFENNKKMRDDIEAANDIERADEAEKPENIEATIEAAAEDIIEVVVEAAEAIEGTIEAVAEVVQASEDTIESKEVIVLNTRAELELFLEQRGIEKLMEVIGNMKASELRGLAKEYQDGELQEDKNVRATKAELIDRLYDFYSKLVNK